MANKTRWLTEIGLLAALIAVTGTVKLPGLLPGTEFQISAPLAVAICAVFGFIKYISAGILASVIGLVLGTQNLLNVLIAIVFRLSVGSVLGFLGITWPAVTIAGPVGSAAARLAMGGLLDTGVIPLLIMAGPGMIYTALAAWPLTVMLKKVKAPAGKMPFNAVQR